MKKVMSFLLKNAGFIALIATVVGTLSMKQSACFLMYHQPEVPKALDAYRR